MFVVRHLVEVMFEVVKSHPAAGDGEDEISGIEP